MKNAALAGILLLAASLPASAELAVDDILKLHRAGVEADTIITLIQVNEQVFRLETEEIIALKKAGVPEAVIRAMIQTALEPSGEGVGDEPVVLEDGSILLTNLGKEGESRPDSLSSRANVVPSRPSGYDAPPSSRRTPVPATDGAYVAAIPLPPADLTAPVVLEDRGYFGIGYRWHPSWDQPRNQYPVGAYVDAGGGVYWGGRRGWSGSGGAGYYFLPSSFAPNGSSFGQFGFQLNQSRFNLYDYRPLGSLYLHPSFRPKK